MRVEILRPFTCSLEGGSVDLKAGDVFDVPDRLIPHLLAGGYASRLPEERRRKATKAEEPPPAPEAAQEAPEAPAPAEQPAKEEAPASAPETAEEAPIAASEPATSREMYVRHVGRGKYAVFLGRERLTDEGMSQAEAQAALRRMLRAS